MAPPANQNKKTQILIKITTDLLNLTHPKKQL